MSESDNIPNEMLPVMDEAVALEPEEANSPAEMRVAQSISDDDEPSEPDCPPCKAGAPGWMATFADMATLLMAFFVLILAFADTETPKFEQINGSIKAAFGIRKIVPTIKIPSARSLVVESFTPAIAQRTVVQKQTQRSEDITSEYLVVRDNEASEEFELEEEFRRVESALADEIKSGEVSVRIENDDIVVEVAANSSQSQSGSAAYMAKSGQVNQRLIELSAAIMSAQTQVARELKVFIASEAGGESAESSESSSSEKDLQKRLSQVRADLNSQLQQGLVEVELIDNAIVIRLASQDSFVSGSADLQSGFLNLLAQIGKSVAQSKGGIRIEGHTDNIPIVFSDRFSSNWDLSAVRAASVANYLSQQSDIDSARLRVKGFADTVPIASNESAEGRARNRRIEIIIDGE